jgi:hypothetical protein
MRLAGRAKAGFYPTPPRVTQLFAQHLKASQPTHLLDPCAGEGEALATLALRLRASAQAIELSRERAARCRKQGLRTFQGDSLTYRGAGFGLLYLNPPYDDGFEERLELTFLKHWTPALTADGVLVFLIPERILPRVSEFLTAHYHSLLALRFPQPEYRDFQQVVVFGCRRKEPAPPQPLEVEGVLGEAHTARVYALPPSPAAFVQPRGPEPEKMLEMVEQSPLWRHLYQRDSAHFQPLLPLKDAHLALLIAGGLLNNEVIRLEGEPYLIQGQIQKQVQCLEEERENYIAQIERETFVMSIAALNLWTGALHTLK